MARIPHGRAVAVLGAAALVLAACGAPSPDPVTPDKSVNPDSPREDVPSAIEDMQDPAFPQPLIDPRQVVSGGPPPEGIPTIDSPRFATASETEWLQPTDPVLSLTVGGETRGYPLGIMTWHEIVNDTVGGVPVAVTYCPLCNSGVAFEREVAGRVLTFGTSGMLYNDNLVMYDRQTESLWPQLTGEASIGVLTGTKLVAIPMGVVGWADFAAEHPDALVLTRDTGFERAYGTNPYVGYDEPGSAPLFGPVPDDERLLPKARVIGIEIGAETVGVARDRVADEGETRVRVGGQDLVLVHRPGQASALDAQVIPDSADIGSVAVFREGSTGERTPIAFLDTFWFVWVAFHPETRLVR